MCSINRDDGSGFDPHALPDGELLAEIADAIADRNRLDARITSLVRVADTHQSYAHDGLTSMKAWLRGHVRMSKEAAAVLVRNGRALTHLPAVEAGYADGRISAEQVSHLATLASPDSVAGFTEARIGMDEVDDVLARAATEQRYLGLTRIVKHYRNMLDADGREPEPITQRSLRRTRHADGSLTCRIELDPVGAEKFDAALESIATASRGKGDERAPHERAADALVQLCDLALAAGTLPIHRGTKPQVAVIVKLEDLLDPRTGPDAARTGFAHTLSAARVRWLACDATIGRIVLGPDGRPIDRGRDERVVPHHTRQLLDLRDDGCVFAGCDAPPYWCEAHHLIHWAFGGQTNLDNLALLCERHHGKVHHGYDIRPGPDGTWHTYRPDKTEILIGPSLFDLAAGPPG